MAKKIIIFGAIGLIGILSYTIFSGREDEDGETTTAEVEANSDNPSTKKQSPDDEIAQNETGEKKEVPMGLPVTDEMRAAQPTKKDLVLGSGKIVGDGSQVKYEVVMQLKDGKVVFNSRADKKPWVGKIGDGSMISGLDQMMRGMFEGEKRGIWLPPHLAYGEKGIENQIPPNSWIYAEVEVLGVY